MYSVFHSIILTWISSTGSKVNFQVQDSCKHPFFPVGIMLFASHDLWQFTYIQVQDKLESTTEKRLLCKVGSIGTGRMEQGVCTRTAAIRDVNTGKTVLNSGLKQSLFSA